MIQDYIYRQLKDDFKELEWTVDYKTSDGNYGAVYYDGGRTPQRNNDAKPRHMFYQIVIQHEDYETSERIAFDVWDKIHGITSVQTKHFDRDLFVQYIYAEGEPIRVGVVNDRMIYTLNFDALIYPDCCE